MALRVGELQWWRGGGGVRGARSGHREALRSLRPSRGRQDKGLRAASPAVSRGPSLSPSGVEGVGASDPLCPPARQPRRGGAGGGSGRGGRGRGVSSGLALQGGEPAPAPRPFPSRTAGLGVSPAPHETRLRPPRDDPTDTPAPRPHPGEGRVRPACERQGCAGPSGREGVTEQRIWFSPARG